MLLLAKNKIVCLFETRANDGDVEIQVLSDSTHQDQNPFAFTSFTDLMMVLVLLLLLNFVFLSPLLTFHLPLQGPSEIDDIAVYDLV